MLALVAVLALGAWAAWVYAVPHYTRVPSVAGFSEGQAVARLKEAGLSFILAPQQFSATVPSGNVIGTAPAAGTRVRTRTRVALITSKGQELIAVLDMRGQPEDAARTALTGAGFIVDVQRAFDDSIAAGRVISENPNPGQRIPSGSTVTIVVSRGPAPIQIPDLAGQSAGDARAALEGLGFVVTQTQEFSGTVPAGDVIRTNPKGGTSAPKGSPVKIVVSKGPQSFAMPDVVGMTMEAAKAKLEGLGLKVNVVVLPNNNPPDTVVFQDPHKGTTVHHGDQVTIYVTSA